MPLSSIVIVYLQQAQAPSFIAFHWFHRSHFRTTFNSHHHKRAILPKRLRTILHFVPFQEPMFWRIRLYGSVLRTRWSIKTMADKQNMLQCGMVLSRWTSVTFALRMEWVRTSKSTGRKRVILGWEESTNSFKCPTLLNEFGYNVFAIKTFMQNEVQT
jgi:hypothetical protein